MYLVPRSRRKLSQPLRRTQRSQVVGVTTPTTSEAAPCMKTAPVGVASSSPPIARKSLQITVFISVGAENVGF